MTTPQPYGLFIIYAREDESYLHELVKHLKPMERANLVSVWTDREILAGEEWEPSLKEELKNADIILLLVSSNYFASNYIHEVEMKEILVRHESGKVKMIPIIVSPCQWKFDPIVSSVQVLPSDSIAVSLWPNREAAWVDVVEGISSLIEEAELERSNKEREKCEIIERERFAAEEAERKNREILARKERERLEKIRNERLAAEKEALRQAAWKNLLELQTIEAYQDYVVTYPGHVFREEEFANYPELMRIHQWATLSVRMKELTEKMDPYFGWLAFYTLILFIFQKVLSNLPDFLKIALVVPYIAIFIILPTVFEWLRIKRLRQKYSKNNRA
ncbi:MAG: TIR domain-containing protein [Saprospiraceae bacterium]